MPDPQHPQVLSLQEAAARLHVDVRTIRRYIQRGRLKGYRLGPKLLRVDAAAVDQLLKPMPAVVQRPVPQQRPDHAAALAALSTEELTTEVFGRWFIERRPSRWVETIHIGPELRALTLEYKKLMPGSAP